MGAGPENRRIKADETSCRLWICFCLSCAELWVQWNLFWYFRFVWREFARLNSGKAGGANCLAGALLHSTLSALCMPEKTEPGTDNSSSLPPLFAMRPLSSTAMRSQCMMVQFVCDQESRCNRQLPVQQLPQNVGGVARDVRRDLVQTEHLRPLQQRPRQAQQLALPCVVSDGGSIAGA